LSEIPTELIKDTGLSKREVTLPSPGISDRRQSEGQRIVKTRGAVSLEDIPGVIKGAQAFVPSLARSQTAPALFTVGDRVRHGRLGEGIIKELRDSGREARMAIEFPDGDEITFSVGHAPVIKI
jgi:hypothetical protein